MAKFYCITTFTPYCGESYLHYLRVEDGDSLDAHMGEIYDWLADDASDWWDDRAEEDFAGDYDSYLDECYYEINEIPESVYLHDVGI